MAEQSDKQERSTEPIRGRFVPGVSGNPKGRPRGWDFRTIVRDRMAQEGGTVEDAIWAVFQSLRAAAKAGDVSASRLLLDRLCTADATTEAFDDVAAWLRAAGMVPAAPVSANRTAAAAAE